MKRVSAAAEGEVISNEAINIPPGRRVMSEGNLIGILISLALEERAPVSSTRSRE